jgi:hypothetical protein
MAPKAHLLVRLSPDRLTEGSCNHCHTCEEWIKPNHGFVANCIDLREVCFFIRFYLNNYLAVTIGLSYVCCYMLNTRFLV